MATLERDLDTDASLVLAIQAGDTDAFSELFRRHYPAVRRVCARRLRDLREADEVAQAAFVRAFERIDQCDGDRRFGAWVQVIAQRLCIDAIRARTRTTPEEEPVKADAAVGPNAPEDALLRHEEASQMQRALQALPPRQRDVVIARDVEQRRPGEIAAALGLSIGAVDSLLLRARKRLAVSYEAAAGEGGLASLPATAAATGMASGAAVAPGRVARAADAVGNVLHNAAANFSGAISSVPAMSSLAHDVGAALVAGVLVLAPLVPLYSPGKVLDRIVPGGPSGPAPAISPVVPAPEGVGPMRVDAPSSGAPSVTAAAPAAPTPPSVAPPVPTDPAAAAPATPADPTGGKPPVLPSEPPPPNSLTLLPGALLP